MIKKFASSSEACVFFPCVRVLSLGEDQKRSGTEVYDNVL